MTPLFREGDALMPGWANVYKDGVIGNVHESRFLGLVGNGVAYRIRVIPKPSVIDEQIKAARDAHKPVRRLLKAKQDVVTERLKRG